MDSTAATRSSVETTSGSKATDAFSVARFTVAFDTVEPVERLLDARRAPRARHAGERQVDVLGRRDRRAHGCTTVNASGHDIAVVAELQEQPIGAGRQIAVERERRIRSNRRGMQVGVGEVALADREQVRRLAEVRLETLARACRPSSSR